MTDVTLHQGDCLAVMRTMPDASVDAIVTDPPYHLTNNGGGPHGKGIDTPNAKARAGAGATGFMGLQWDGGDIAFRVELWAEALRVLKPGGHLLAFSGSRTYHRMVCAIEDAGFEIRDQIQWVYSTGFPKSRSIVKDLEKVMLEEMPDWVQDWDDRQQWLAEWQGWGTALKPAHEPICVARKPLAKGMTVAANVQAFGTGALNIDGCRVHSHDSAGYAYTVKRMAPGADQNKTGVRHQDGVEFRGETKDGRWPANLIHDGAPEVVALFPAQAGARAPVHKRGSDKFRNSYGAFAGNVDEAGSTFHGDQGSAARFFYCAKASKADRDEGNDHPTVKPTDLMAYLCRLVTPPGGVVLDIFMGSGSTGKAAVREGFHFVGIDMTPHYVEIARRRIEAERERQRATAEAQPRQPDLFG